MKLELVDPPPPPKIVRIEMSMEDASDLLGELRYRSKCQGLGLKMAVLLNTLARHIAEVQ